MELKALNSPVDDENRLKPGNPFNGIERKEIHTHNTLANAVRNPFNGIERFIYLEYELIHALGIESVQWN